MIKLTVKATIPEAYRLIDDRMPLFLSSRNLRGSGTGFLNIRKDLIVQNVDDTIYYFEKEPHRGALLLAASTPGGDKVRVTQYGIALRSVNEDRLEIYIDTYRLAVKRGILRNPEPVVSKKIAYMLLGAFACFLLAAMAVLVVPFVLAVLTCIVCYPFIFWREKRRFKRVQATMHAILSLFETSFPVVEKEDTKDWITFLARVKSASKEILIP